MFALSPDFSISFVSFAFVCFLVGLAGFVDASAGGGGLISIPAYLFTGMPAHFAYGCNKVSAACGTTLAVARFWSNGAVDIFAAIFATAGSLMGSAAGARFVLLLSDSTLRTMQLIIIPCAAVIIMCKRNYGEENNSALFTKRAAATIAFLIGFFIGGYDAVFGPGTGTFAIFAFAVIMKFDLKTASGNAKILNLASGVAALITFAAAGTVYWKLALPCAACNIIGNQIGSSLALKNGAKFIRPMMICVIILLLAKIFLDLVMR